MSDLIVETVNTPPIPHDSSTVGRVLAGGLILVVLFSLAWRFYDLNRDPASFSWSAGEFIDPGTYLYNARSYARTGHWRYGEDLGFQLAPGFALISGFWLRATGPSYASAALLSVLLGFIAIICTALAAEIAGRRWFQPLPKWWTAIFALWSLSISYPFFGMQQIPNGDMAALAFSAIAAVLLMTLDLPEWNRHTRLLAYCAGLALGLAPFFKLHAGMSSAAAVVAWFLAYWVEDESWHRTWKRATLPLALGLASSMLVWAPWYFEMRQVGGVSPGWNEVAGVFSGPLTTWAVLNSNILYRQPVELVLAMLAAGRYLGSVRKNWPLLLVTVWFISGLVFISAMSYSPLRYRFVFIVPTVILAAHLGTSLIANRVRALTTRVSRIAQTIALTLLIFLCIGTAIVRFGLHPGIGMALLYTVVATAIVLSVGSFAKSAKLLSQPAFGVALMVVMLAIALPQWLVGEFHRGHDLQNMATKVAAEDPRMVLSGDVGAEIALWTDLDVYLNPDAADSCRVTHLLMREHDVNVIPEPLRGSYREIGRFVHPSLIEPILLLQVDRSKLSGCPAFN